MAMSPTTVFGIVVIAFAVVGIAIVTAMFLWAAREDGRAQRRTNARVARVSRARRRELR